MLTGINFSPPLYFVLNFCFQLIFPTSIEQLRIQSLIFIIIGIILCFLLTRRIFGTTASFVATILVASQSNILLSQTQEARHYAMFFACGAWVLYIQSFHDVAVKRYQWITFLSHICLCQVHYLGIIFSFLSGIAYFLSSKNRLWKRIPTGIIICWIVSIFSYLFYLTKQKSVLNTWPKPNQLSDLLAGYNDSLLILTILIPLFVYIIKNKSDTGTKNRSIEEIQDSRPIIITSFLWFSVPFMFWILSHFSSLNLFFDRYFIPKEAALIYLVAHGFNLILQKLPKNESMSIPILGTFAFSVVLVLVSSKRDAFGLNKDTNYHHSLIIEESYPTSKQPIILEGDPKYFPNAYLNRNEYLLLIKDEDLIKIYNQFSRKIKLSGI
jgi:4-amino-4-deoxy-L-arabinose transferase-like glycosyltransferase